MTLDKNESIEKYACDSCKLSKVTCSRQRPQCERCGKSSAKCIYTRSGIIRRNRKRRHETTNGGKFSPTVSTKRTLIAPGTTSSGEGLQSHLTADIEETRETLSDLKTPEQHKSLGALSSLSDICSTSRIGGGVSEHGMSYTNFIPFEEYAVEWTEVFERFLHKGGPSARTVPQEVLNHLRAARPHQVQQRAWLVIYYTIILDTTTSTSVKEKLRQNLRLALSDVAVLLEPTEINIHALVLVLSQASEFTGPSLCWMLATSACRMLQALGVIGRDFDSQTRERRRTTFWHLNLLDKGLAIIFGRTPTFHRQMVREIGLPRLEEIQPFKRHLTLNGSPSFFGVHYMYQKILLSHLMDDIWDCLYGDTKANESSIERSNKGLELWYEEAKRTLEAAALSEKPFCDIKNSKSIDIALRTIDFHFLHLTILLTRSCGHQQEQCLDASKRMLHLLQYMAPESREPYHPIIWQLVCCPFTPMLLLFRSILSSPKGDSRRNVEAVTAMEQLPSYLHDIGPRNSLARTLEGIAQIFVQHARVIVHHSRPAQHDAHASSARSRTSSLKESPGNPGFSNTDIYHLNSLFNNESAALLSEERPETVGFGAELDIDLRMFANNLDDGLFDWLSWESQAQ